MYGLDSAVPFVSQCIPLSGTYFKHYFMPLTEETQGRREKPGNSGRQRLGMLRPRVGSHRAGNSRRFRLSLTKETVVRRATHCDTQ